MSKKETYSINLVALTILFVILKLFGAIDWSWWWVFCPIWISWALIILVLVFAFLFFTLSVLFKFLSGK